MWYSSLQFKVNYLFYYCIFNSHKVWSRYHCFPTSQMRGLWRCCKGKAWVLPLASYSLTGSVFFKRMSPKGCTKMAWGFAQHRPLSSLLGFLIYWEFSDNAASLHYLKETYRILCSLKSVDPVLHCIAFSYQWYLLIFSIQPKISFSPLT